MEQNTETHTLEHPEKLSFGDNVINILSRLLAIPAFIILHKSLPNPDWVLHLDRILLFLGTLILLEILLQMFRRIVLFLAAISFAVLVYGSFTRGYGFVSLTRDYLSLISEMLK